MKGARRRLLRAGLALSAVSLPSAGSSAARAHRGRCGDPAPWDSFATRFLSEDGRILDPSSERGRTVSEAQAYALFFALVANDQDRFERVLRWTRDNLAGGDLGARLPAWSWGRRDDASWGVQDENSASDADLWMAYALAQAGRLWDRAQYRFLADALARRILDEECEQIPGLGLALLPGRSGFASGESASRDAGHGAASRHVAWRLNPGYAPPFLLRWFARNAGDPRWTAVHESSLRVLREAAPRGFAPDWIRYEARDGAAPGFHFGPRERAGSYDAIRVYLWIGMTSAADPARAGLISHFAPMAKLAARANPPETIDVLDLSRGPAGPPGFAAALLPMLRASGHGKSAPERAAAANGYYDEVLRLFGLQWARESFSFEADGALAPAWVRCAG